VIIDSDNGNALNLTSRVVTSKLQMKLGEFWHALL